MTVTAPLCWICLGDENRHDLEHLRRDCSCRGTAGFVHLSCLVEYAKKKNQECDDRDQDDLDLAGVQGRGKYAPTASKTPEYSVG
ncbi:hypothetical protein ACHAW5_000233 [Stephanodiscus triporus]|uniref:RING-CH-type domain-containing protein n=1 Tax=Stephanodiscus triporus TaxID=2934178 RepID=A0ABD3QPB5_9STRA